MPDVSGELSPGEAVGKRYCINCWAPRYGTDFWCTDCRRDYAMEQWVRNICRIPHDKLGKEKE